MSLNPPSVCDWQVHQPLVCSQLHHRGGHCGEGEQDHHQLLQTHPERRRGTTPINLPISLSTNHETCCPLRKKVLEMSLESLFLDPLRRWSNLSDVNRHSYISKWITHDVIQTDTLLDLCRSAAGHQSSVDLQQTCSRPASGHQSSVDQQQTCQSSAVKRPFSGSKWESLTATLLLLYRV